LAPPVKIVTLALEVVVTLELEVVGILELEVVGILELEVDEAALLNWGIVDTTVETAEAAFIDETVVTAVDETEMIDEGKDIADNVMPLTDGIGIVSPTLDRTTVTITCCIGVEWPLHMG
jgi:hypothetical protein